MQINAYLLLGGQCEAAFKFYERALGARILALMTLGNSPAPNKFLRIDGTKSFTLPSGGR